MTRQVPAHYIRENKAARVPRRLIVIDTEAHSDRGTSGEIQTWRCGAAVFIHWTSKGYMHRETRAYSSAETLWAEVAAFTRPKQRTVLYAHNLPYDMRIGRVLRLLPDQGFKLDAVRVASQGSWSRWSRNGATLVLCDSASIFPVTIYTLGQFLGVRKLPLPEGDDINEWMDRCIRDVEILADTLVEYFDWLRTGVAGNWQLTGAGQSWAHWRHGHYTHQVLIHSDSDAIEAERRAMFTGRAEAYQWGRDYEVPIYEWDWQNAYPRIARDIDVPVSLACKTGTVTMADFRELMKRYIVLADVTVTTEHPVVPARHDGRILWPIGTFDTTLWQPEIEALLAAGGSITVHRSWLYRPAPALRQWASWVLHEIHGPDAPRHKWRGILLKHWSRALIGRFATQYQDWELLGLDPVSKVMIGTMVDNDTGEQSEFMQVGHEIHMMTGLSESDDSCPQITSYIMSVARAKLWTAIMTVGLSNVLYVDTDSLVVNMQGNAVLSHHTSRGGFDGLRLKSRQRGYEIYGPRAAIIGDNTILSGVPRNSHRTSDDTWAGEVWTQMERSLRIGEWDRVSILPRRFTVRWNEHRRKRVENGRTVPYTLPGYRPSEPVGRIAPTTERERQEHIRRQIGGKRIADDKEHRRNAVALAASGYSGIGGVDSC